MRYNPKRAYTGLATILATLVFATSAEAQSLKGICMTFGEAKVVDKTDENKGIRLVGGTGYYTFAGIGTVCAGASKGVPAVVAFHIDSTGYFHTTVCGTGKAVSSNNILHHTTIDTTRKGDGFWAPVVASMRYAAEFVNFEGVFYAFQASLAKNIPFDLKPLDDPKPGDPSAFYDPAGIVRLPPPIMSELEKPAAGGPKLGPNVLDGNCTKAFHVDAVYKVDL